MLKQQHGSWYGAEYTKHNIRVVYDYENSGFFLDIPFLCHL